MKEKDAEVNSWDFQIYECRSFKASMDLIGNLLAS